jgi:hypothetical protein
LDLGYLIDPDGNRVITMIGMAPSLILRASSSAMPVFASP